MGGNGGNAQVRFGVSGWSYKDWSGPLYPKPLPQGFRGLPLLASFLHFMEVNATFYHPMGGSVSRKWLAETPTNFTFLAKAWQGWTHDGLAPQGTELKQFREVIDPLLEANRYDGTLVQFPPAFRDEPENRRRILRLRDALTPSPVFVEVRHRSLYSTSFLSFLEAEAIGFVNVDLPDVGTLPRLTSINTSATAFVRLHGRNSSAWRDLRAHRDERYNYHYRPPEITEIVTMIRELTQRTPRVLVAANNHFSAGAPAAAVLCRAQWEQRVVPAPTRLIDSFEELHPHCTRLDEFTDSAHPSVVQLQLDQGLPPTDK